MSRFSFSIQLGRNFNSRAFRGIKNSSSNRLLQRIAAKSTSISKSIGSLLKREFNKTPVAKALRGQSITDLPAHFGLTDQLASELADNMANVVSNSVSLRTKKQRFTGIVEVRAVNKTYSDFLNLPGASYISTPSNIRIPVMRWMLLDPNIDIGQAAYDIVFLGAENGRFDNSIIRHSRSGRAIMIELGKLAQGSSYVLPAIVRGQLGKNFIEIALGRKDLAKDVGDIIIRSVRNV